MSAVPARGVGAWCHGGAKSIGYRLTGGVSRVDRVTNFVIGFMIATESMD